MKHNWEYKKLKEVCQKGSSNIQQNKIAEITGNYPVYGASGFVQNVDFYHQEKPYIGIVKDGSGVGRVNIYPAQTSLLGTMQYILPNDKVLLGYLAYCLQSLELSKFASGAAIPHIYFRDYGESFIPLPPLPIQQKIVAELDKVCLIIEKKKQQLKELDKLAQAIFYDMFGDPVENEKGWDTCMLGDMCEIGSSKRIFAEEYTETGIPFYRGKEVSEKSKGQPTSIELYISSNRYAEIKDKYGVPKIGDILLTAVGTIGNIWVVDSDEPFYFKDGNVLWLQKKTEASSVYLKYLLEDLIEVYKKSMANGCAYNALTIMNLKKMPISIIPLSLQQSFAAKIEAIEKQKELISRSIKEAQTLFDERMDYWFD